MYENPLRPNSAHRPIRLFLTLTLLAGLLGLAAPARADEPEDYTPAGLTPGPEPDSVEEAPDPDDAASSTIEDTMMNPNAYEAQRAETHPFARLGLFAGSRGYRMGREDPTYDVEGGASFRFIGNFFLTGSYRILDYRLDAESFDIENGGPLFGVLLRF